MRKLLFMVLSVTFLWLGSASAQPNRRDFGVVAGTTAGLVVAHNVHGVNPWVAEPVGGLLGGYFACGLGHGDRWYGGVDLIKVSILNSNGVRTHVPVLRIGGKFVEPQGEEYPGLPTDETLTQRYGM